jgi:hypothetical protein
MRLASAAQERTLRCSGAWPQTRRAATNKTEARALQAIPPATGTIIGHLIGRVIWDSSKNLLLQRAAIRYLTSAPGVSDYGCHLLLGLGSGGRRRLGGTASRMASMRPSACGHASTSSADDAIALGVGRPAGDVDHVRDRVLALPTFRDGWRTRRWRLAGSGS